MTITVESKPVVPPSPPQLPLVGNTLSFARNTLGFIEKCSREIGGVVLLNMTGQKSYLITDPDAVEYVLVTNSRNFKKGKFYDRLRPLFGSGLVTSEGDFWLHQRRLIQPAFHRAKVNSYAKTIADYTEKMLKDEWRDGQVRQIDEDMKQLTLKIIARLLFNMDLSGNEALEAGKALGEALSTISQDANAVVKIPENIPTPGNLRIKKAIQYVNATVYDVITKGRANLAESTDEQSNLLSMLLELQDEDGQRMNDQQLRDEVLTLYIAGHETTAITLTWAWYLLAQHPEVERKLVEELQTVLAGRTPTVDDLSKLTYTDMVIKEVMRLYPVAWMVARQAINDCEVNGYHIPANSIVLISPWATHHNPKYFEQPHDFKPERWEPEAAKKLHKFAYYPFVAGPRQCIGTTLAQTELALIIATVAQNYSLRLLPGEKVTPKVTGTLPTNKPLMMQLRKR